MEPEGAEALMDAYWRARGGHEKEQIRLMIERLAEGRAAEGPQVWAKLKGG